MFQVTLAESEPMTTFRHETNLKHDHFFTSYLDHDLAILSHFIQIAPQMKYSMFQHHN
jgi:hypothetical protein